MTTEKKRGEPRRSQNHWTTNKIDKTESMIVSRKSNRPIHPPLMMDNKII